MRNHMLCDQCKVPRISRCQCFEIRYYAKHTNELYEPATEHVHFVKYFLFIEIEELRRGRRAYTFGVGLGKFLLFISSFVIFLTEIFKLSISNSF